MFGHNFVRNGVLLLCLLAPSVWMVAAIPPLWRDADAYVQLTEDPRIAAFWGHAPAYCYIAKIPLYLGEQWERLLGQRPVPRLSASQPALTNPGIWMLVGAQHLGLGLAALRFITAISRRHWVRLGLALIWASNALFYTFAHCLGSETLGMILIVLLAAQAVRVIQHPLEPAWHDWYLASAALLLCILSRDLNLALITLLPIGFLISWLWTRKSKSRRDLRHAAIALVLSITCVLLAYSVKHNLARKTRLHPHSRLGYTFLWRLHLLNQLSPESRTALLERVKARADSDEVRYLISLLGQLHAERVDLTNPYPLLQRAIPYFGGSFHWIDLDRALNQMALTFLWPPSPELFHAAQTDFVFGLMSPPTGISDHLFATTAYYFQHRDEMPACAGLVTFRGNADGDRIQELRFQHPYFQLWRHISYMSVFLLACGVLIAFALGARRRAAMAGPTVGLAMAMPAVGLLIFAASCVLHDFEPRFCLPMWQLLLFSLFLLLAKTAELFLPSEGGEVRRAAVRSEP